MCQLAEIISFVKCHFVCDIPFSRGVFIVVGKMGWVERERERESERERERENETKRDR
jgi:hypothetical protein